jgi:hypothetical protein
MSSAKMAFSSSCGQQRDGAEQGRGATGGGSVRTERRRVLTSD